MQQKFYLADQKIPYTFTILNLKLMKNTKNLFLISGIVIIAYIAIMLNGCGNKEQKPAGAAMTQEQIIERGKFLVGIGGCNDCHSPKIMTEQGPVVDESKLLSGSPQDMKLPPIDTANIAPGHWYLGSSDLTAWVGPWGISYAANLTPDSLTGIGAWTEELFIKIFRTGQFMGIDAGRPVMPPMPTVELAKILSDDDLKSIFAYLKSLPAISNSVHAYVPPNEISQVN